MKARTVTRIPTALVLVTGVLAGCGGSYGGGGGGGRTPASLSISVSPETITLGQSATLTWNSNAPNCTASGAWSGSKASAGTESVTPTATGTLTYSLVCSGGRYGESNQGSATLTVNPASQAAAFKGEACCVGGEAFAVAGITSESGELRFLASGRHFVVKAGKPVAAYATCESCLAGARVNDGLAIDLRSLTSQRPVSESATLEGHYTTHLGNGYTLTVSIDAAGRMTAIDTRGCRVDGRARTRTPASRVVEVALEVSACGDSDGHYTGDAALFPEADGEPGGLLLSASNRDAAIGWRLSR
ncbi:MAG: hypothetical protein ACREST_09035 [Steroidobacteraceae bacterium]